MTHRANKPSEVEFVSLMGDHPVVIAAGSMEEVGKAIEEGQAIDREIDHSFDEGVSPGTRHAMGKLSTGLGPEAQDGLNAYSDRIQAAKRAQREQLRSL